MKLYFPKNNKGDWTIWRHKIQIPTIGKVRLKEFGYLPQGVTIKNGHVSYSNFAHGKHPVCLDKSA